MTHDERVGIAGTYSTNLRAVIHEVYGADVTPAAIRARPDAKATWGRCERTAVERTIAALAVNYGVDEAQRRWALHRNHQAKMRHAKPGRHNDWAALDAMFNGGRPRARRGSRRRR